MSVNTINVYFDLSAAICNHCNCLSKPMVCWDTFAFEMHWNLISQTGSLFRYGSPEFWCSSLKFYWSYLCHYIYMYIYCFAAHRAGKMNQMAAMCMSLCGLQIVLFHNYFSPSTEQPEQHILAYKQNNQLQVIFMLLYKIWGYYNRFDSMKSLGLYYWYVKMPRCGCVHHGLEYITFCVQKYITHLVACSGPLLVCNGLLGVPTLVKLTYTRDIHNLLSSLRSVMHTCRSKLGHHLFRWWLIAVII